jgi:hypothetical protein
MTNPRRGGVRHLAYRATRLRLARDATPVTHFYYFGGATVRHNLEWYLHDAVDRVSPVARVPRRIESDRRLLLGTASTAAVLQRPPWSRIRILDPGYFLHSESMTGASLLYHDVLAADEREWLLEVGECRYRTMLQELGGANSACLVATGPSLRSVDPDDLGRYDVRMACNSSVKDKELLRGMRPNVFAFGDSAFHYGPSAYATQFRSDLKRMIDIYDPWVLTTVEFFPLLHRRWGDEVTHKFIPVPLRPRRATPTGPLPVHRRLGNVLTTYMLPAATTLSREVTFYGCDGRDPSSERFWNHHPQTEYEELYQGVVDAHPSFFAHADYRAYYERHCRTLANELQRESGRGTTFARGTPSFIPALASLPDRR